MSTETDRSSKVEGTSHQASVFDLVVPNGLCVGCGMCAALLPGRIRMSTDEYGAYLPVRKDVDLTDAEKNLTLSVCPFSDREQNEDTIGTKLYGGLKGTKHRSEIGYYLECLVGHVTNETARLASSSGGLLTWLLGDLLRSGVVDAIVCVGGSDAENTLFDYQIIENPEELIRCRKSRYYPVEVSKVIPRIKAYDGKVAFVGLPCFVKALRYAMMEDHVLRERVSFTVGLFCGHLKTRQFAFYLARCCGVHERDIVSVDFRKKVAGRPANQYAFEVTARRNGGEVRREVLMKDVFAGNWSYNTFMLDACDCCDDILAETADIAVGDAWLLQHVQDYRGTSVVVCRRPELLEKLLAGRERGEIALEPLPVEEVIRSQAGGLRHRRAGLSYRLHLARKDKQWRPRKRVQPDRRALPLFYRVIQHLRMKIKLLSREAFLEQQQSEGIARFVSRLRPWICLHDMPYGMRRLLVAVARRFPVVGSHRNRKNAPEYQAPATGGDDVQSGANELEV